MHLVIDVGNTESVVGLFEPGSLELAAHWRVSTHVPRTPDEFRLVLGHLMADAGLSPGDLTRAVVGSVVPRVTDVLVPALDRLTEGRTLVVRPDTTSVRLDVEEPMTVGADRIVNTLAASKLYGRDTIAVDMGTATTFDCITADGVFLGGVIAPGVMVGLEWFSARTAKLPRVELAVPDRVIGKRTEACMQSGVFYMAIAGIDGVVRRIVDEWSPTAPLVVATGGYAELVGPHCETIDRIEPYLTLKGLQLAGDEA
jgi:type III pantothenate kinase